MGSILRLDEFQFTHGDAQQLQVDLEHAYSTCRVQRKKLNDGRMARHFAPIGYNIFRHHAKETGKGARAVAKERERTRETEPLISKCQNGELGEPIQ